MHARAMTFETVSPLWRQLCLALLLAIGFAVPYMIAVIWLAEVRREFQSDKESLPIESLIVASDGTPLIRSYSYPTLRHEYRTLDGQPAPADSEQGAMYSSALFGEAGRIGIAYQKGWDGRIYAFADASSSPAYWYFVVVDNAEEGRGFFEGYDAGSRQRVGYLGVNGFTTTRPAHEQQFPVYATGLSYIGTMFNSGPFQNDEKVTPAGLRAVNPDYAYPPWLVYLHSDGRLLKIDLNERTVADALGGVNDVISVGQLVGRDTSDLAALMRGAYRSRISLIARRPDRIVVLDPLDGTTTEFRIPAELLETEGTFYRLPDGNGLAITGEINRRAANTEYRLIWFDPSGEIIRKTAVRLDYNVWARSLREELTLATLALPVPALLPLIPLLPDLISEPAAVTEVISQGWPGGLLVLGLVVALTFAVDRRQRKFGLPHRFAWMAFVLLLGLPGYAGYRLHRRWPIGHAVPPPVRTGIEIMA